MHKIVNTLFQVWDYIFHKDEIKKEETNPEHYLSEKQLGRIEFVKKNRRKNYQESQEKTNKDKSLFTS